MQCDYAMCELRKSRRKRLDTEKDALTLIGYPTSRAKHAAPHLPDATTKHSKIYDISFSKTLPYRTVPHILLTESLPVIDGIPTVAQTARSPCLYRVAYIMEFSPCHF